jgi:hypothetical protein
VKLACCLPSSVATPRLSQARYSGGLRTCIKEVTNLVYDPDEIRREIEILEEKIQHLLYLPVFNSFGEVVSYADLTQS